MVDHELAPIHVAALGFLAERPMHPYEMYQLAVHRREDKLIKISPGTLYRAIYALEEKGLVESRGTEREGARPERTLFAITDAGTAALREAVEDMLATPAEEYTQFPFALSQSAALPVESVIRLLEDRLAPLRDTAQAAEQKFAMFAAKNLPDMYWLHARHAYAMMLAEIEWLENTIAQLRSGEISWNDSRSPEDKARSSGQFFVPANPL